MRGSLEAFIAGLPKAELHVHHVGSASPRVMAQLAQKYEGSTTVPTDPAELERFYKFTDFDHFIQVYIAASDLLRDAEDIRLLTYEVARDMAAQSIRYAELTVTAAAGLNNGIAAEDYVDALEDARLSAEDELGIVLRWCFDIPGGKGLVNAQPTLDFALNADTDALVSFGLGGMEVPRPQFAPFFEKAVAAGLHSVPHAGEVTGPESVWSALNDLKAERIGHGIKSIEDPALIDHLGEHGIPLEVCPTSNLATGVVASIEEHPLKQLVESGLLVTINSDDPPMFGTDLVTEYVLAARLLDLDAAGIAKLAKNAVTASFLDPMGKARLTAQIDGYLAAWAAR